MANQSSDPAQFLASLLQAGQDMVRQFTQFPQPGEPPFGLPGLPGMAATEIDFMAASKQFMELQQGYFKQMADYVATLFGGTPSPEDDKRFAGEAWKSLPGFDLLRRTYGAYAEFLKKSVEAAPLDEKAKGRLRFAVGQYLDAMSPANFFATNPEALKLAQETGGQSLIEGMRLYFQDLAKGRVSMTDEAAFEVGKNVAVSEGAVVYENELIQLIQYSARTEQVLQRPLVIIPPCINKFYILDLQPDNSFVRYAVEQGQTVFLVSWRNIPPELGQLGWDDYLTRGVMPAIDVALELSGADRVNTLGFCIGGALLSCALAIQAARGESKAASVTLLTTLLDYSETGELGLLVSEEMVALREAAIGKGGVMRGAELATVFSMLRANDLIWQYVVNSYLKGKAPPAFDLLYWNADATNLPGPMYCWYLRNTYLENKLKEPGATVQCGVPVDLTQITVPAFVYASREDHIVPWRSAYASRQLLGGETSFVLGASGHIAGVINPAGKNKRNYWAGGAADADAERWLATANRVPGSWWPDWSAWLARHGGPKVPARALGNAKYRAIEPAPGRYVKEKAV